MSLALEIFADLLNQGSEFQNQKGEPFASVGEFIRSEVQTRQSQQNNAVVKELEASAICQNMADAFVS